MRRYFVLVDDEWMGNRGQVGYLSPENREGHRHLTIYDSITLADEKLLPNLSIKHKAHSATLHPTCSMHHTLGGYYAQKNCGNLSRKNRSTRQRVRVAHSPGTAACCTKNSPAQRREKRLRISQARAWTYISAPVGPVKWAWSMQPTLPMNHLFMRSKN
jgi:hypothetical protein